MISWFKTNSIHQTDHSFQLLAGGPDIALPAANSACGSQCWGTQMPPSQRHFRVNLAIQKTYKDG